jgi:hypothetical protein
MQSREKYLARQTRYNRSKKGRARWRKYASSPKGQAARDRFEASHIRIPVYDGTLRIPRTPETEAWFETRYLAMRDALQAKQASEREAFKLVGL